MAVKFREHEDFLTIEGNLCLSDREFRNEKFNSAELYGIKDSKLILKNVSLIDCETTTGTCLIGEGAVLTNVVFHNFKCGDGIHFDTEPELNNVKISGDFPRQLWMVPFNVGDRMPETDAACCLDISQYNGTVTMRGLNGDKVRINPERHAIMRGSWREHLDWSKAGIPVGSYWRDLTPGPEQGDGVFSLPESDPERTKALEEKKLIDAFLQDAGVSGS